MVELVDTGDLKSPGYCSCAGSSPAPGTTIFFHYYAKSIKIDIADGVIAK